MQPDHRIREIISAAKERAGSGWALLGPDLQAALIDAESLKVISANSDNPGYERAAKLVDSVRTVLNN